MTVNLKLQALKSAKESIENALIAKGADLTDKTIADYGDVIETLPNGPVTSFAGVKEFASLQAAEELNDYDTVGAVLSYDNGVYKVWNGDPENLVWNYNSYIAAVASDYNSRKSVMCGCYFINSWSSTDEAEIPTTYGTPIAVCVGKGLWIVLSWSGMTTSKRWANSGSTLYNTFISGAFNHTGADSTKAIFESGYLGQSPLFTDVKAFTGTGIPANRCFVPSSTELFNIFYNLSFVDAEHSNNINFRSKLCAAVKFVGDDWWSSSQYTGPTYAYRLYNANFDHNLKTSASRSFACLRFGDALAS